ncbi:MAG: DUF2510 domain-containing protein [Ilumatobacteraceae bacterium]
MAWNFLQVVEIGATSYGIYPVPTGAHGNDLGIASTDRDTNPTVVPIAGLKVLRATNDGTWVPSLNVLRTKGRLVITDDRLAVTFDKFVPKDLGSFDPVAVERPDGGRSKRPKQMLVGHVALGQIRQIGVRQGHGHGHGHGSNDKGSRDAINDGLGSVIIAAVDATDTIVIDQHAGVVVAIEIIIGASVDPVPVVNDVLARLMTERLRTSALEVDQPTRDAWAEMARIGFTPPAGEVQTYDFDRSQPVRRVAAHITTHHLIPPTDTSPVPTMLPTPALAMPALAGPSPADPASADPASADLASADPASAPTGHRPLPAPVLSRPSGPEPSRPGVFLPAPPPPGSTAEWRTDPFARHELRFWDGFGWTEHVHSNGQQSADPPR